MTLSFFTRHCLHDRKRRVLLHLQKPIRLCVMGLTRNYGYSRLGFVFIKQLPHYDVLVIYLMTLVALPHERKSNALQNSREMMEKCIANNNATFWYAKQE